ncbi:hypothetical protein Z949_2433 [Sulfitobacter guttiformis KCTC 32187]|nr:hypothetical protein Z949_2433 [Sulfitobacter guttiformis KCTC 32187]
MAAGEGPNTLSFAPSRAVKAAPRALLRLRAYKRDRGGQ